MTQLIMNADKGTLKPSDVGTSASQGNAVGSGSRPTKSMYEIQTAASNDVKTQGREPSVRGSEILK